MQEGRQRAEQAAQTMVSASICTAIAAGEARCLGEKVSQDESHRQARCSLCANDSLRDWIPVREVPEDTDLGIDGYIEFVEDEVATGIMLGVQIKTGPSYLVDRKREQFFEVTVSRRDLEYWRVQPIPTAIVFFEPASSLSG